MTKQELSQLHYLNREIEEQKRRLSELEHRATSRQYHITGMPRFTNITDKAGEYAAEIADLRTLIDLNIKKCFRELNALNQYIATIEDSQMRMILSLRYINNLSWRQIAMSIGGGNTEDSVRKAHNRFLTQN